MKKGWKYLLAAFFLTAGLLSGCNVETIPAQRVEQAAGNGETESRAGSDNGETESRVESGNGETEGREGTGSAETESREESGSAETESQAESGSAGTESQAGTDNAETESREESGSAETESQAEIREDASYTSKEEVAEYLFLYGHLPDNFITKKEAKALGWVSSEGNLAKVAPGKSIGGDYFGNYEGNLPEKEGREYHECDIDSDGGYRGAKRIVYSNDGLIYYTEDHYETFELLYGEE